MIIKTWYNSRIASTSSGLAILVPQLDQNVVFAESRHFSPRNIHDHDGAKIGKQAERQPLQGCIQS
jgi:hypothetical protein